MKIALDLGHGIGRDRGAIGILSEEEIINLVGKLIINKLRKSGHEVVEVRPKLGISSLLQSLNYRTIKSNSIGADLYLSIHANAGGGYGSEVFTFGGKELKQAKKILDNLSELGFVNRGIKDGSDLYVIKYSEAEAILVELFFVDSTKDIKNYKTIGPEAIANAIVDGINVKDVTLMNNNNQVSYEGSDNWILRLQQEINIQGFGSIVEDGIAGSQTLEVCPTIQIGAKGNITKLIQEKLNILTDGIFGNITLKAILGFQWKNNLIQDGIVGKNTWRKLLGL